MTPCVQVRRLVAAKACGDTSQRQIASFVLEKFCKNLSLQQNFVVATSRTNSVWFHFFATCCCDKILLQRQRFSQKLSSTNEAICRCDVSSRHVSATCRLVCTDLKEGGKTRKVLADAGKPYGEWSWGRGGGGGRSLPVAFVQIGRKLTRLEWMIFPWCTISRARTSSH